MNPTNEALSGSDVNIAAGSFIPAAAAAGNIVLRPIDKPPTGNGGGNGPRPDDPAAVAFSSERNGPPVTVDGAPVELATGGGWYVGAGRPGVIRRCDHCGRVYQARRSTSRYCGASCRAAAWHEAHGGGGDVRSGDPAIATARG